MCIAIDKQKKKLEDKLSCFKFVVHKMVNILGIYENRTELLQM